MGKTRPIRKRCWIKNNSQYVTINKRIIEYGCDSRHTQLNDKKIISLVGYFFSNIIPKSV